MSVVWICGLRRFMRNVSQVKSSENRQKLEIVLGTFESLFHGLLIFSESTINYGSMVYDTL